MHDILLIQKEIGTTGLQGNATSKLHPSYDVESNACWIGRTLSIASEGEKESKVGSIATPLRKVVVAISIQSTTFFSATQTWGIKTPARLCNTVFCCSDRPPQIVGHNSIELALCELYTDWNLNSSRTSGAFIRRNGREYMYSILL